MTASVTPAAPRRCFFYEQWRSQLAEIAPRYRGASPFPHLAMDGFLEPHAARAALDEFPSPRDARWIQYKHFNENKLGNTDRNAFPPHIGAIIDELQSPEFVSWLIDLTGISGLIADPLLDGGGMHQTEPGGFLNMHTDFTRHHVHRNWRRRCNLIVYLNDPWEEQWGGALEFWDRDVKQCCSRVWPTWNRAVLFNTTEISFHGYPDPIGCPAGTTRKSLALYYYTVEPDAPRGGGFTQYRARPSDSSKRWLIWLDTKAIHGYTWLKRKLGFSDNLASRLLGWLSRWRGR